VEFVKNYLNEVRKIAESLDLIVIDQMIEKLKDLRSRKGRLFILGVGGSAGNATHAVNDFRKLAHIDSYAPTDNVAEITARTNDEGWETVFDSYLEISNLKKEDCILVLSVGGGDFNKRVSVNLCRGIEYAKSRGALILAIVGKTGGYAHKFGDLCLVIPEVNKDHITPHSEAFQAIIWHLLVSDPRLKASQVKW